MRRLVWFVLGMAMGLCAAVLLRGNVYSVCICVLILFAGIIFRLLTPCHVVRRIAALLMFGCVAGMFLLSVYSYIHLLPVKKLHGSQTVMTIRVSDYSREKAGVTLFDGKAQYKNKRIPVSVHIPYSITLEPGDKVTGEFSLYYIGYDAQNRDTYHQGNQILMVAYAQDGVLLTADTNSTFSDMVAKLRNGIRKMVDAIFPQDTKGLATALLLGDSSGLSVKDDIALKNSGIRHIIAVSGLHVSILCTLMAMLFGNQRWPMACIGIPVLIIFAAVAGFTPSIVRACVMQILLLLANLLVEDYDPPSALAFAVLLILGADPLAILSVSFQLSVGCVLGIYFFSEKVRLTFYKWRWLKEHAKGKHFSSKLLRWLTGSLSISISAMSLTVPISAYYFGTVSLVSVLSNMLTLWLINYVFYGIVFACILSWIFMPIGMGVAGVISFLIRYILLISSIMAKLPFSCVSASNIYIKIWLLFAYTMFVFTLCSKKKHAVVLVGCIGISLITALTFSVLEHAQDRFRVTVLDVGQGQCVILQNRDGCYVVDCGGNGALSAADVAASTLRTMGIRQVDGLILTHFDVDHAGHAEAFLTQIDTKKIYVPDIDPEDEIHKTLKDNFSKQLCELSKTCYLSCGDDSLTIYPQNWNKVGNESSMCVLFQTGDYDILITGDLDAAGEKALIAHKRLPDIEILVCGHHGANSSSCFEFLQAIQPKTAVISAGKDNRYGHPHSKTLDRLQMLNCRIWRTDINGTIVFRG